MVGLRDNQNGFSLIELMIVVAIVGVLSTVALPNYQRMVGKARQVEAKEYLSSLFTVEKTFYAENGTYTYCLYQGGFEPTSSTRRFYLAGFQNATSFPASTTTLYEAGGGCLQVANMPWGGALRNDAVFEMNAWASPSLHGMTSGMATFVAPDSFLGNSYGSISPVAIWDIWTIDQNRVITNLQPGI